jgi:hypothetical protein
MPITARIAASSAQAALTRLASGSAARRGLHTAAGDLLSHLIKAPPQRRARALFTSDRQRRGFFARLRRGDIRVPYARSGGGWQIESASPARAERVPGGEVRIINRKPYAPFVWGARQTAAHRLTGWRTADDIARAHGSAAARLIAAAITGDT